MTLTDLLNHHYANAMREGMIDLTLGRSDHEVKIGDIVEMLLSISFAVKDAMLECGVAWHRYEEMATPKVGLGDVSDRASVICEQYGSIIHGLASLPLAHCLLSTRVHGMPRMAVSTCVSNL